MCPLTYHRVTATAFGPPEVLQVTTHARRPPAEMEARIRVLAATVCRPEVSLRRGDSLYHGTPLGEKLPFVPGYACIGEVDATGSHVTSAAVGDRVGALTVTGSWSEYLYWRADHLIPVPKSLNPAEAIPLLLNYLVAYQTMHRVAKVKAGETALIIGASGGIGTALLQLGRLAGLQMYGLASRRKHPTVIELGATPIDYHTQDFTAVLRTTEPAGLDVVFDGIMTPDYIRCSLGLLRHGGRLVSYGEPQSLGTLAHILATLARTNLTPDGKRFALYGTSTYFLGNRQPYLEDWQTLFRLLAAGKIQPVIAARFPLLEAAQAHALLEGGDVTGNVVLVAPELL